MHQRQLKLREDRHQFISDSPTSMTHLLRQRLDDEIENDRNQYPTTRRTWDDWSVQQTSVLVTEEQQEWLVQNDVNCSALLAQFIDERMQLEQQIESVSGD